MASGRLASLLLAAALACGCAPVDEGLCPVELHYVPAAGEAVASVVAAGDLPGGDVRLGRQPAGHFASRLELPHGDYAYRLLVDGAARLDPRAALSVFDEHGLERSLLRVADCRLPLLSVERATASSEAGGELEAVVAFVPGRTGASLDPATVVVEGRGGAAPEVEVDAAASRVTLRASRLPVGKHTFLVRAADRAGRAAEELVLPLWLEPGDEPFDWHGALIYQVVVDRFARSGPALDEGLEPGEAIRRRHGGDLEGLLEVARDGYFDELGVRALWVSPLYRNPEGLYPGNDGRDYAGYHGYWPVDPLEVEPTFGGEAALDALVAELHGRGMRLVVDVVPNHVHVEHPYYLRHRDDGWLNGDGECVCGVTCSWWHDLESCWFTPYLADLDWRRPEVSERLVGDMLHWLERFDLDGLRVDAVPMMPRLAVRHLAWAVSQRLERGPTPVHLLGETYTGLEGWTTIARYIGPFGLDGQFDFPVLWAARSALAEGSSSMEALDGTVRESERTWAGSGAAMSPIVGNHDVPRLLSVAAGADLSDPWTSPPEPAGEDEPYQRALLAHALLLTLPGAPVLYYGDEIGLPGAGDPDNRRPMRFGEDLSGREASLLAAIGRLGRARRCSEALRRGTRRTLLASEDEYVFVRDAGDGSPAIVLLGRAAVRRRVVVELPEDLELEADALRDVLTGGRVRVEGRTLEPVTLEPRSALVLLPEGSACAEP